MFVQLWNSFPRELKRELKIIYTNVTEKKQKQNMINIRIPESTENAYYVTRQNLHFVHAPYNKNKN